MRIKLFAIIFIISSISVLSAITIHAQDCSLNGAPAMDDCLPGTTGDDIFIITGEVNLTIITDTGNDLIDISNGGSLIVSNGYVIYDSQGELTVIGGSIITSADKHGIVQIGSGSIINSSDITTTNYESRAINEQGDGDVINYGTINTAGQIAMGIVEFNDGDIINYGDITTTGINARGLFELGEGSVINYGIITTSGDGLSHGINEVNGGDVINYGVVIVSGVGASGIFERHEGNIYNYGTIISNNGIGIDTSMDPTDDLVLNNGVVSGSTAAILTGDNNDTVINNGKITGDINLGTGDDTMVVNGVVNGMMDGGDGWDTIKFILTITGSLEEYDAIARELANMNPNGGSIVINGQLYEWRNFEDLRELLRFVDTTLPCATDGRINLYDCHAPVAIYGYPLQIYAIDPNTSEGYYAFTVTQDMIDAAGIPESGTVLIYEGTHPITGVPIAIYRHWNGDFQINTYFPDAKPYVGIWTQYGGFVNHSGEFN